MKQALTRGHDTADLLFLSFLLVISNKASSAPEQSINAINEMLVLLILLFFLELMSLF